MLDLELIELKLRSLDAEGRFLDAQRNFLEAVRDGRPIEELRVLIEGLIEVLEPLRIALEASLNFLLAAEPFADRENQIERARISINILYSNNVTLRRLASEYSKQAETVNSFTR